MKNILNISLGIALLLGWSSCSDSLDKDVKVEIDVAVDGVTQSGDVIEVKKGSPITFSFSGNPDFISYYSGENGFDYFRRFETELSPDRIDSELQLYAFVQYGTADVIENSMRVFISTDFPGLTRNNAIDLENVSKYPEWREITSEVDFPTASGKTSPKAHISLNEYFGKEITFAFWYCPHDATKVQPKWRILDFSIVNTEKANGEESKLLAGSMGFIPFDEKKEGPDAYTYATTTKPDVSGVWNLADLNKFDSSEGRIISELNIHSTSAGAASLNSDWLITKAIKVNSRTPDRGLSVKTVSDRTDDFVHTYQKVGEYKAVFVVTNGNMDHVSQILKEYTIRVVE